MSEDFENFGMDFDELDDAADQLQDAYADGLAASQEMGEDAVDDIDPSHKIIIDIELKANVEGHNYLVSGQLIFMVDLNTLLDSEDADIDELSAALDEMDKSMTKMEKQSVMKQLSMPRTLGYLEDYDLEEFVLFDENGDQVDIGLNEAASLMVTKQDGSLLLNFEGVFSYPKMKETLYYAVPSGAKMQENIVFDVNFLDEDIDFEWEEDDKDGLKVSGSAIIKEL